MFRVVRVLKLILLRTTRDSLSFTVICSSTWISAFMALMKYA